MDRVMQIADRIRGPTVAHGHSVGRLVAPHRHGDAGLSPSSTAYET